MIAQGIDAMLIIGRQQGPEVLALLRNPDSMTDIHDRLWKMPDRQLPTWWKMAMRHYNVLTGRPRTPLYR